MTCKRCDNRDTITKICQVLAWGLYLAPIAYATYQVIRETGVIDKAVNKVKPAVNAAVEYVTPYAKTAAEEAEKFAESLKEKRDVAVEFIEDNFDKLTEEAKEVFTSVDRTTDEA